MYDIRSFPFHTSRAADRPTLGLKREPGARHHFVDEIVDARLRDAERPRNLPRRLRPAADRRRQRRRARRVTGGRRLDRGDMQLVEIFEKCLGAIFLQPDRLATFAQSAHERRDHLSEAGLLRRAPLATTLRSKSSSRESCLARHDAGARRAPCVTGSE